MSIAANAVIVGLRDVYHPNYPAAEASVPDQYRADIFLKEFAEFEKNGKLPRLVLLLLYDDHTSGTSPGFPTPRAMVADNDLALGRIVEAISKSRYWKESAIFVTEDDSQDGLDHVDGHRTVGLVISPYTKHGTVDSTLYTIVNMFRTMEQILGLPPVNQFDLAAEPMFTTFSAKPDLHAVHGASQPDSARRNEPRAGGTHRAAGASLPVLHDHRQLGAGLGAGRHAEPGDLALGEGIRHAVQLRPADQTTGSASALASPVRGILGRRREKACDGAPLPICLAGRRFVRRRPRQRFRADAATRVHSGGAGAGISGDDGL